MYRSKILWVLSPQSLTEISPSSWVQSLRQTIRLQMQGCQQLELCTSRAALPPSGLWNPSRPRQVVLRANRSLYSAMPWQGRALFCRHNSQVGLWRFLHCHTDAGWALRLEMQGFAIGGGARRVASIELESARFPTNLTPRSNYVENGFQRDRDNLRLVIKLGIACLPWWPSRSSYVRYILWSALAFLP